MSDDLEARLSADELTVYFVSNRNGNLDIWTAQRATPDAAFSPPVKLPGAVNTSDEEFNPSVTQDGLTMYLEAGPSGLHHIQVSHRATTSDEFGAYQLVPGVNSALDDTDCMIMPDESALYFGSRRTGQYDLYSANRDDGGFATPTTLTTLNDPSSTDAYPTIRADGLQIFFASSRAGGQGDYDVYEASRQSLGQSFASPVAVSELNTSFSDAPSYLTADGCEMYLSSNRPGGLGNSDIWVAKRPQ